MPCIPCLDLAYLFFLLSSVQFESELGHKEIFVCVCLYAALLCNCFHVSLETTVGSVA